MISSNGVWSAGRRINGESVAARGFFKLLWKWSSGGRCQDVRKRIDTQFPRTFIQRPAKSRSLILRKPQLCSSFRHQTTTSSQQVQKSYAEEEGLEAEATIPGRNAIPESLRHLMRALPSTVVVLTTSATEPNLPNTPDSPKNSPDSLYRGMTISSFTTLSLFPPLVTFNIRAPSRTLSAIEQSRCFLIHVLESSKEGAMIADSFTRGNSDQEGVSKAFNAEDGLFKVENVVVGLRNKSERSMGKDELELPKLSGKSVKRVLACALPTASEVGGDTNGLIKVGNHVMVIAKVTALFPEEEGSEAEYGLSYVDGSYRKVGEVIGIHDTKTDIDGES